ncbi:hypothetical protein NEOLEDRAFT_1068535 [Neolentinus lepideus HHB14362 ss-1]|uniref:DUF4939 domain-containing protein n=1 Tax=Neolentinus lepideus HHB14362 ss-1 TaxID=1314782 RepID=A0A165RK90_9AGAM|nr:hypothetical protein NEOLEDRAFT_1068535 [Neolentinus lepideus HHB14362 ss-1]
MPEAKKLQIGQPDPFDGSHDKLRGFLIFVDLYTMVNRAIYDTDEKKIVFALSFMKGGRAGPWAESFMLSKKDENRSMQLGEYKEFQAAIEGSFLEMDMAGSTITKLHYLKQTKMADEYMQEFCIYASCSGLKDDAALIEFFEDRLQLKLLNHIYGLKKMPTTIKEWYEITAPLDNQLARLNASKDKATMTMTFTPRYLKAKDPDAMDVDRLTKAQWEQYKKEGLASYVGERSI